MAQNEKVNTLIEAMAEQPERLAEYKAAAEMALRIRMREVDGYASAVMLVMSQPRFMTEAEAKQLVENACADAAIPSTAQGRGSMWTLMKSKVRDSQAAGTTGLDVSKNGVIKEIDIHAFIREGLDDKIERISGYGVAKKLGGVLISTVHGQAEQQALELVTRQDPEPEPEQVAEVT